MKAAACFVLRAAWGEPVASRAAVQAARSVAITHHSRSAILSMRHSLRCLPFVLLALILPAAVVAQQATTTPRSSRIAERAHQDREIVYFLRQPETHAFDLYHDYTETRAGVDRYLNVVRGGSTVSNPSAKVLDTGAELPTETLRGEAITRAGIDAGTITPQTEVVVIRFPAVRAGESLRLRISETYTDSARYFVENGELVWDRAFGRPANAVVLPAGWYLTGSSIPATVSETDDGRIRLDFINPRPDQIQVLITARRRG